MLLKILFHWDFKTLLIIYMRYNSSLVSVWGPNSSFCVLQLLFFKSKLINAYQHPLFSLPFLSCSSSPSLICGLSSSSLLLLLLPPVRDDFFGKAHLAYAHGHICLLCHSLASSFHVLLVPSLCPFFVCGFIFIFCATFASHTRNFLDVCLLRPAQL